MGEIDSRLALPSPLEPIAVDRNGTFVVSVTWYNFFNELYYGKEDSEGFEYQEHLGEIDQALLNLEDEINAMRSEWAAHDVDNIFSELSDRIDALESEMSTVDDRLSGLEQEYPPVIDRLTTTDSTPSTFVLTDDNTNQTLTGNLGALILKSASGGFGFSATPSDTDLVLTFYGTTHSGILKWMEDEDYFQFDDNAYFALDIDVDGTCRVDTLRIDEGGTTTVSTGTGTVKMASANNADSAAWIPINYNGTTYYVPAWTTYSP